MDKYKVEIINKHIEAMRKDEYALTQLKGPGDARYINLDEEALQLLVDYYSKPKRYDIAVFELPPDEGITQSDMVRLCELFDSPEEDDDELLFMDVDADNSAAMGFIRRTTAEEIAYRYEKGSKLYDFIASILNDVDKESSDGSYTYRAPGRNIHIWMSRK